MHLDPTSLLAFGTGDEWSVNTKQLVYIELLIRYADENTKINKMKRL